MALSDASRMIESASRAEVLQGLRLVREARTRDARITDQLRRLLSNQDVAVVTETLNVLRATVSRGPTDNDLDEDLIRVIDDPRRDGQVRASAIAARAIILDDKTAVIRSAETWLRDPSRAVRREAINTIGRYECVPMARSSNDLLFEALNDGITASSASYCLSKRASECGDDLAKRMTAQTRQGLWCIAAVSASGYPLDEVFPNVASGLSASNVEAQRRAIELLEQACPMGIAEFKSLQRLSGGESDVARRSKSLELDIRRFLAGPAIACRGMLALSGYRQVYPGWRDNRFADSINSTCEKWLIRGLPVAEVFYVLGIPTQIGDSEVVYRCDDGRVGVVWSIKIADAAVVSWTTRGTE